MKNIFWNILKILLKLFAICLWGVMRLAELTLQQINLFLQSVITKPSNTKYK